MACNSKAMRVVVLIFTVAALALSIVGCFIPFFSITEISGKSTAPDTTAAGKYTMTLWKLKGESKEAVELRTTYFTCSEGRLNVQAAEGVAAVVCVLGAANAVMSIFLFFFKPVVKFPLALYEFFAAGAAACTFAIMLHLYLNGWCGASALKDDGWKLSGGIAVFVVACALYLVSCILCIFV